MILGPCRCQGCGRSVYWGVANTYWTRVSRRWRDVETGRTHRCRVRVAVAA